MKNIEKDKLNQLLQIIQDKPAQRIVHFSDGSHLLSKAIAQLCKERDNRYYLNCCSKVCYEKSLQKYGEEKHVKVANFNLARPRYKIQAIEYDYLFATLNFENIDKASFLKKCYDIIRSGGNIIIFIPNSTYTIRDEWVSMLEEHYYVSTTVIDDMFDDYDLIISKRMHGWGRS